MQKKTYPEIYIINRDKISKINGVFVILHFILFSILLLNPTTLFSILFGINIFLCLAFNSFLILTKKENKTVNEDYEPLKNYIQKNHTRSASSHWAAIEKRKFLEMNKTKDNE